MCVRDFVLGSMVGLGVGLTAAPVIAEAQTTGIREVSASERSVIPLQTRLRYTTLVVLPEGEEIIDVICGDKDWWVISATQNIAHVKPAKEGATTNLNLVTTSGAVYSFLLTEKADKNPAGRRTSRSSSALTQMLRVESRSTTQPPSSRRCKRS
jgi:hypothetical protein